MPVAEKGANAWLFNLFSLAYWGCSAHEQQSFLHFIPDISTSTQAFRIQACFFRPADFQRGAFSGTHSKAVRSQSRLGTPWYHRRQPLCAQSSATQSHPAHDT